ncbi:MAG: ribonuclease HI [Roseibacillus sp.]
MPLKEVEIFSDGACRGNPGPGGYGVVLKFGAHRGELSRGFARTTNNRMELLGAIAGLEELKHSCLVTLCSDSRYLVNAMTRGWLKKWKALGWRRGPGQRLRNEDLWKRLDAACEGHEVNWQWVKGHAGHAENERCDVLAVQATEQSELPADEGYLDEEQLSGEDPGLFD